MDTNEQEPANDDDASVCTRCGQGLADFTDCMPDGCRDPACPGMAEAA